MGTFTKTHSRDHPGLEIIYQPGVRSPRDMILFFDKKRQQDHYRKCAHLRDGITVQLCLARSSLVPRRCCHATLVQRVETAGPHGSEWRLCETSPALCQCNWEPPPCFNQRHLTVNLLARALMTTESYGHVVFNRSFRNL